MAIIVPVMITVRFLASIPSVTCSAVEADPNPLEPGHPVINERIPTILSIPSDPREVSYFLFWERNIIC